MLVETKLNSITKILENNTTLPANEISDLKTQQAALNTYKNELTNAKTTFEKINTSLPVKAEEIIKEEFRKLEKATDACTKALSKTNIEPDIMNALKILLDKFKEYFEYFKPTLEGQMKKLSSPK